MSLYSTTSLSLLLSLLAAQAQAADGVITAGAGSITHPVPTQTLVTTTTPKTVINWANGINTASGETLQFAQPNANSIALNIVGGGRTNFAGNLLSNGKVWIINPEGMLFNGATINVGSLTLSNAGIANPNGSGFFTNNTGHYDFNQTGNKTASIVLNNTTVNAAGNGSTNGDVLIMAPGVAVENNSRINTLTGEVMLQAGETFAVDFDGDGLISYSANAYIINPVSQIVAGADASVTVGSGSRINTRPLTPQDHTNRVYIGADVYQEAVLNHVINIGGQYYDAPPLQSTGPSEGVQVNPGYAWAVAPVVPAPPVVVPPVVVPPAAVAPAPAPVNTASIIVLPLTRPVASLGDETVRDTVVNPYVANVAYARPYLVSLSESIADGKLTLAAAGGNAGASPTYLGSLSPAAGGANAQQLANLSPSAGGAMSAENLASLSPSAGGGATTVLASGTGCANAYLDTAWLNDPALSGCAQ